MSDLVVNDSLLEQFTCPVCIDYMDKKIYICLNGHSICGSCNSKLPKCPICKVKLNSKRNITLEKASKKVKEWRGKQEIIPACSLPLKRHQRLSLGSPIMKKLEKEHFENNQVQCPHAKCCYSTKYLLQLKIHLQSWHSEHLFAVKKDPTVKSEDSMRIRLYWPQSAFYNMFIITATDAFFVIYIVRSPKSLNNTSYYLNVLTVSNETRMYKFSCGTTSKFSSFYQGRHQAQDGIEVDDGTLETICQNGHYRCFVKILITKVASLHQGD